jgi:hypothetical protein
MNQTLKTIAMAVTAFLFLPGVINAGDAPLPQTGSLQTPVPVVISYKKRNNNNKPKAPSMQHIECWYEDGMLTLDFAIPEGDCVLTVTEEQTGMSSGYSFDSAPTAQVYIGEIWNATIEINTENGHSYEGWLGD